MAKNHPRNVLTAFSPKRRLSGCKQGDSRTGGHVLNAHDGLNDVASNGCGDVNNVVSCKHGDVSMADHNHCRKKKKPAAGRNMKNNHTG